MVYKSRWFLFTGKISNREKSKVVFVDRWTFAQVGFYLLLAYKLNITGSGKCAATKSRENVCRFLSFILESDTLIYLLSLSLLSSFRKHFNNQKLITGTMHVYLYFGIIMQKKILKNCM